MTNKIYYFEIPDPDDKSTEEKLQSVFVNNLDPGDDEKMFFCDSKKLTSTFYAFWPSYKLDKIVNELKALETVFFYKDITEAVLLGVQNNDSDFTKTFRTNEAKNQLNMFLKNNLSKDTILDKIRMLGIGSLTDTDKQILEDK